MITTNIYYTHTIRIYLVISTIYSIRHHIKLYIGKIIGFSGGKLLYFNADAKTAREHSSPTTCLPCQCYLFTKNVYSRNFTNPTKIPVYGRSMYECVRQRQVMWAVARWVVIILYVEYGFVIRLL